MAPIAKWARDELILALDLYFEMDFPRNASDSDERIEALTRVVNSLPLRDGESQDRTPKDLALILADFLRFDPEQSVMPARIGETAERVWGVFAAEPDRLRQTAESIRSNASVVPMRGSDLEDEIEFGEGRILTRIHLARERNATLVSTKKRLVMTQTGKLACEACEFDFQAVYG